MSASGPGELRALTSVRGIAAWFVVLYHIRLSIAGLSPDWVAVFAKGYLAVDFFFLLSGFVIWLTWSDRLRAGGWRMEGGFPDRPKFVFIDGRTGATMYSEGYREEILYNAQQNTPALSSYFELMDRLVPNFLSALSSQKIRGTRVLLN